MSVNQLRAHWNASEFLLIIFQSLLQIRKLKVRRKMKIMYKIKVKNLETAIKTTFQRTKIAVRRLTKIMSSVLPLLWSWHEKPNGKFKMNSKQWFRVKIQNKKVSNAFMITAIALSHLFTASNATLSTFTNQLRDSNVRFVIEHSLNASILWSTFMPM